MAERQRLQNVAAFVVNAIQLQVVGVLDQLGRRGVVCTTVTRWLGISSGALRSVIEYGLALAFLTGTHTRRRRRKLTDVAACHAFHS